MTVEIPRVYKRQLMRWLRSEFGIRSEKEATRRGYALGWHICPVIMQTTITFAICQSDGKMIAALKLERQSDEDQQFLASILALCPPTTKAD